MSNEPNYRTLSPPTDKKRTDYTYVERRAELYNLLEDAGHYRNLERSTRELGNRYGVSHTTIRKDIQRILAWKADHLGENAHAELETLKTKAVRDALDNNEPGEAYSIISQHLSNLQSLGVIEEEPDKHELQGEGGGPLQIEFNETIVETDYDE